MKDAAFHVEQQRLAAGARGGLEHVDYIAGPMRVQFGYHRAVDIEASMVELSEDSGMKRDAVAAP